MIINYLEELQSMTANGSHELGRDLDFQDNNCYQNLANKTLWTTGNGWTGAANGSPFTGQFDGKGFKIKNLYINNNTSVKKALFIGVGSTGAGMDGVVRNLHLVSADLSGNVSGITTTSNSWQSGANTIIEDCSFDGNLNLGSYAQCGGIVGFATSRAITVRRCKATGNMSGTGAHCGAIGGEMTGNLIFEDCYSEMTGIGYTGYGGGMVGCAGPGNMGVIPTLRQMWTNKVIGGRLICTIDYSGVNRFDNFFDSTTTGIASQVGATARTTAQMMQLLTFTNWNIVTKAAFSPASPATWFIDEGIDYPRLWWEYTKDEPLPETKRRSSSAVTLLMMM